MATKTYDPALLVVVVNGILMSGFAENSVVDVERINGMFSLQMGADGTSTRSKSNDKSGRITLHLMQTSASNDIMSLFALIDETIDSGGKFPVMIKDLGGRALHSSDEAWVVGMPKSGNTNKAGPREWMIETGNLDWFEGDN